MGSGVGVCSALGRRNYTNQAEPSLYLESQVRGSCADDTSVAILIQIHTAGVDGVHQDADAEMGQFLRLRLLSELFYNPFALGITQRRVDDLGRDMEEVQHELPVPRNERILFGDEQLVKVVIFGGGAFLGKNVITDILEDLAQLGRSFNELPQTCSSRGRLVKLWSGNPRVGDYEDQIGREAAVSPRLNGVNPGV